MDGRELVSEARKGLWHLRHGGPKQLVTWWKRRGRPTVRATSLERILRTTVVRDAAPTTQAETRRPRVAAILDEFSARAWERSFDLSLVTPQGWRSTLDECAIEMLFVESAWSGNGGTWQYQLTGSKAPSQALQELVAECRRRSIPTVFWNKEDPPHFEDFLDTARLFDRVFTTDVNKVADYRRALGHDHVAVLPFAAAEHLHNPARLRHGHQAGDVAFAGTYFAHKFPERRQQMDLILGGALDVSPRLAQGLHIYSRFENEDERYRFPGALGDHVVGSLPYDEMLVAYKAYKVFLNVNSVVDSPSMCARRIFEILASGTPVVTTGSAALPNYFAPEEVPVVESREDAANVIRAFCRSSELRDRTVHRAQRRIWDAHTYRHRAATVCAAAGLGAPVSGELPHTSVLISTNRPHQVAHVLAGAAAQRGVDKQVVLVCHGFALDRRELDRMSEEFAIEHLVYRSVAPELPLGACLREAVSMADGQVFTKMDDDDYYGPEYLADLLRAMRYTGADIVGKQAHYMHVAATDATLLRFSEREHRWTDRVMGPTITGRRAVFERVGFSDRTRGEDTDFLERALGEGASIYSADRFNFIQLRTGGHTWDVGERELMATGVVQAFGDLRQHVTV